jgi:hypothetical protein
LGYLNCNSSGLLTPPYYGSAFRDDGGCGGYTNGYNYLIGGTGCVGGAPQGPNLGYARPYTRFMNWLPVGDDVADIGTFPYQPYSAGLGFLKSMFHDAFLYMRAHGKPGLTIDWHGGLAFGNTNPQTTLGSDRLYNPAIDTWVGADLNTYRSADWNGALFFDGVGADPARQALVASMRLVSPVRLGQEGFPLVGNGGAIPYTLDLKEMIKGPAWTEYATYIGLEAQGLGVAIAPPRPFHEAVVIMGAPLVVANHAVDLARCISLIQRGFVLGAGTASDAGPHYPDELLAEAYAGA